MEWDPGDGCIDDAGIPRREWDRVLENPKTKVKEETELAVR